MGLKNVSLCRCYAVMPHMCHYADFDAGIKRLPQLIDERGRRCLTLRAMLGRSAGKDRVSSPSSTAGGYRMCQCLGG